MDYLAAKQISAFTGHGSQHRRSHSVLCKRCSAEMWTRAIRCGASVASQQVRRAQHAGSGPRLQRNMSLAPNAGDGRSGGAKHRFAGVLPGPIGWRGGGSYTVSGTSHHVKHPEDDGHKLCFRRERSDVVTVCTSTSHAVCNAIPTFAKRSC